MNQFKDLLLSSFLVLCISLMAHAQGPGTGLTGTLSLTNPIPNGYGATTQAAGDSSTDLSTDAFVANSQWCPRVIDQPMWSGTSSDIGLVMNTMYLAQQTAGNLGGCVSLYGLPGTTTFSNNNIGSGIYYGNTNPFAGLNQSFYPIIQWPSYVQIVTSVPWDTTAQFKFEIGGLFGQGKIATGAILMPCVIASGSYAASGCGPNGYPEFTVDNVPDSLKGPTTITGTATFPSANTSTTISNVTNVSSAMVNGYIAAAPGSSCPSNTNCYTGFIVAVNVSGTVTPTGATCATSNSVCLSQKWAGTNGTGASFTVYEPNATAIIRIGFTNGLNASGFGADLGGLTIDGEGITDFVGVYNATAQEKFQVRMDGIYNAGFEGLINIDSQIPVLGNQGAGRACALFDRGYTQVSVGGPTHFDLHGSHCATGASATSSNVSTQSAGWIWEEHSVTRNADGDGPDGVIEVGSCTGASGVIFNDCLLFDGGLGGTAVVTKPHIEYSKYGIHCGPTNPSLTLAVEGVTESNTTTDAILLDSNCRFPFAAENVQVSTGNTLVDSQHSNTLTTTNNTALGFYRVDADGGVFTNANPADLTNGVDLYNGTLAYYSSGAAAFKIATSLTVPYVSTGTSPPTNAPGSGGAVVCNEGTGFTGVSATDGTYCNSTNHRLQTINGTADWGPSAGTLAWLDQTGVSTANSGSAQNVLASTPATGHYRLYIYADQSAGCTTLGSGALTITSGWTDATHARTGSSLTLTVATADTGTGDFVQGTQDLWAASASAITITATYTACTAGTWTYDLHAYVERVE